MNDIELIWKALYISVVGFATLVIVLENRNPVKTMAWVLCVIFLPVVGLILYIFFGQNLRKTWKISRRMMRAARAGGSAWKPTAPTHNLAFSNIADYAVNTNKQCNAPTADNSVLPLLSGYDYIAQLLKAIQGAKRFIFVQVYIWDNDPVGRLIRDALINKVREGVRIKVLYDDVGCWHTPDGFFRKMKREGIEVHNFLRVAFPVLTRKANYRNHRKLFVIDGETGFVGGMNLAVRYVRGNRKIGGVWRDTMLMIRGDAVQGMQASFANDWQFEHRKGKPDSKEKRAAAVRDSTPEQTPHRPNADSIVQTVTSDPVSAWKVIMQSYIMAILQSRRYLYIQTPYFLPTESVLEALQTAALSGVDVRLMLPLRGDSRLLDIASRSYLRDVLAAGVKVYQYRKGFLHAKMLVCDDVFCSAGSANIDFRSLEQNFEISAFIYDTPTVAKMRDIFLSDQRHCKAVHTKPRRGLPQRFIEQAMRLISPLL